MNPYFLKFTSFIPNVIARNNILSNYKFLGGSKVDSAFHLSEVHQISTSNSLELGKK